MHDVISCQFATYTEGGSFTVCWKTGRDHSATSGFDKIWCSGMNTDLESVNLDLGSESNKCQPLENEQKNISWLQGN